MTDCHREAVAPTAACHPSVHMACCSTRAAHSHALNEYLRRSAVEHAAFSRVCCQWDMTLTPGADRSSLRPGARYAFGVNGVGLNDGLRPTVRGVTISDAADWISPQN